MLSTRNQTTTVLAGAGVYAGTAESTSNYNQVRAVAFSDQDSAASGFKVQWSADGLSWNTADAVSVTGGTLASQTLAVKDRYVRLHYTNGATQQTRFYVNLWLDNTAGGSGPLIEKGDLLGYTTKETRIPVGTDGQVLTADSSQSSGVKWETPTSPEPNYVQFTNASSVTLSTNTSGWSDTSTELTITTNGNPIKLHMSMPVSSNTSADYVAFSIFRGVDNLGDPSRGLGDLGTHTVHYINFSIEFIDHPSAGTYTYYVKSKHIQGDALLVCGGGKTRVFGALQL